MKLDEALAALEAARPAGSFAVAANGDIARALFRFDRPENFYMLGSMGLASTIALGATLARPERELVVYDGDGNLLMNLSGLALVAASSPRRFRHVLLDNGEYASTGGQPTLAGTVDLARLAEAAGYRKVLRVRAGDSPEKLAAAARELFAAAAPAFLHVRLDRIAPEAGPPGARVSLTPEALRARFAAALQHPGR